MGKLIEKEKIGQIKKNSIGIIGLVKGTFNNINSEQLSYLAKAKQLVDTLFVGVFSDAIAKIKFGSKQPIRPERDRAFYISSLDFIDYVYIEKHQYLDNSNFSLHLNLDNILTKSPANNFKNKELTSSIVRKFQSHESPRFSTLEIFTYKKLEIEKLRMDDYSSIYNRLVKLKKKSNCLLRSVAALIAKDNLILSEAYNHTSKYLKCERTKHLEDARKNYDFIPKYPCSKYQFICRANHAEQIAIFKALNSGIQLENATLYVTTSPCLMCAHAIFLSGISKVISFGNHKVQDGVEYLKLNNIHYSVISVL